MKSQEIWSLAQYFCGRSWLGSGWAVLLLSMAAVFICCTAAAAGWIICMQVAVLLAIPFTKHTLHRKSVLHGWSNKRKNRYIDYQKR